MKINVVVDETGDLSKNNNKAFNDFLKFGEVLNNDVVVLSSVDDKANGVFDESDRRRNIDSISVCKQIVDGGDQVLYPTVGALVTHSYAQAKAERQVLEAVPYSDVVLRKTDVLVQSSDSDSLENRHFENRIPVEMDDSRQGTMVFDLLQQVMLLRGANVPSELDDPVLLSHGGLKNVVAGFESVDVATPEMASKGLSLIVRPVGSSLAPGVSLREGDKVLADVGYDTGYQLEKELERLPGFEKPDIEEPRRTRSGRFLPDFGSFSDRDSGDFSEEDLDDDEYGVPLVRPKRYLPRVDEPSRHDHDEPDFGLEL